MSNRCRAPFLPLLILALLFVQDPRSTEAVTYSVTDQALLDQALAATAPGDTVLIVGDGIEYGIARLRVGIHLICATPYTSSLAHMEALDLAQETVVEGLRFSGGWPPPGELPPLGSYDASVLVEGSKVSFRDCRMEQLSYFWGSSHYKTDVDPISSIGPILLMNSQVKFSDCLFQNNGGGIQFAEGPAYGCIWQRGAGVTSFENCTFLDQPFPISADGPLGIIDSTFLNCGPGLIVSKSVLSLTGSLVLGSGPSLYQSDDLSHIFSFARSIQAFGQVYIEGNTFVDNPIVERYWGNVWEVETPEIYVPLVVLEDGVTGSVSHNLFIGLTGPAVKGPHGVELSCNDAWEGKSSLWTGGMGDVTGVNGNISQAPIFCSRVDSNYTLSAQSPAVAEPCGVMGAFPVACDRETAAALGSFSARWTTEGVRLRWELTKPLEEGSEFVLERLDRGGMRELFRGEASTYVDPAPPEEGPLRYALGYEVDGGSPTILAWIEPSGERPQPRTRLLAARPNPFNPATTIRFEVERLTHARLRIFDRAGRLVKTLIDEPCSSGMHEVRWHGEDFKGNQVATGVYFYQLQTRSFARTRRMVLLK
jgi:hypothetical protein